MFQLVGYNSLFFLLKFRGMKISRSKGMMPCCTSWCLGAIRSVAELSVSSAGVFPQKTNHFFTQKKGGLVSDSEWKTSFFGKHENFMNSDFEIRNRLLMLRFLRWCKSFARAKWGQLPPVFGWSPCTFPHHMGVEFELDLWVSQPTVETSFCCVLVLGLNYEIYSY